MAGCSASEPLVKYNKNGIRKKTTTTIKTKPDESYRKKLTDSNNKEDDNSFEKIFTKIHNAIIYFKDKIKNEAK